MLLSTQCEVKLGARNPPTAQPGFAGAETERTASSAATAPARCWALPGGSCLSSARAPSLAGVLPGHGHHHGPGVCRVQQRGWHGCYRHSRALLPILHPPAKCVPWEGAVGAASPDPIGSAQDHLGTETVCDPSATVSPLLSPRPPQLFPPTPHWGDVGAAPL